MNFKPFEKMQERLSVDRTESDTALFDCLLYAGELLVKSTVAAMTAALQDEKDRHRYRICHRLVRADGIGDWATVLTELISGPPSQYLDNEAKEERKELTQKSEPGSWQYDSVAALGECMKQLGIASEPLPAKPQLTRWFNDFAILRNKTRGHGAMTPTSRSRCCGVLEKSIVLLMDKLGAFRRPWAYAHRNLSGKYRVTPIGGDQQKFAPLKGGKERVPENGVYIRYSAYYRVDLYHSDPELSDFFLPNGGFNEKRYEVISHITGEVEQHSSQRYLTPAAELPPSETGGMGDLDQHGSAFTNLPAPPNRYVRRQSLEAALKEQLQLERHPIISLTGPGGALLRNSPLIRNSGA